MDFLRQYIISLRKGSTPNETEVICRLANTLSFVCIGLDREISVNIENISCSIPDNQSFLTLSATVTVDSKLFEINAIIVYIITDTKKRYIVKQFKLSHGTIVVHRQNYMSMFGAIKETITEAFIKINVI